MSNYSRPASGIYSGNSMDKMRAERAPTSDALCIRCRRHVDTLVLGDWHPPWALCPDCAREDTDE